MIWVFFVSLVGLVVLFGVKYYEMRSRQPAGLARLRNQADTWLRSWWQYGWGQGRKAVRFLWRGLQSGISQLRRRGAAALRTTARFIDESA